MKNIILLGGAPAIGKTTTAKELANVLNIPHVSTDDIRATMRKSWNRENHPALFAMDKDTIPNPAAFLTSVNLELLLNMIDKECEEVWLGVLELIHKKLQSAQPIIIEGTAIIPEKIADLAPLSNNIRVIILSNNNEDIIKKTIHERGLGGAPSHFSEELKYKQIEWVKVSNAKYVQNALKHGIPVLDVNEKEFMSKVVKLTA